MKETKVVEVKDLFLDREKIQEAGRILAGGGLVAIPTETVYGLAANAMREECVAAIFEAKGRPSDNPLIVHISSMEMLHTLVQNVPLRAEMLMEQFWPGPLTLVLEKTEIVPKKTTGNLSSVAIRMPSHPVAKAIIEAAGVPLAAPSANLSGRPSTTTAQHCVEDLSGRVDMIVDCGPCDVGVESTVLSMVGDKPRLLRPGAVSAEALREALPDLVIDRAVTNPLEEGEAVSSPGMKYRHYSPKAKVVLVKGEFEAFRQFVDSRDEDGVFGLVFDEDAGKLEKPSLAYGHQGAPEEQARTLFSTLRDLDEQGAKVIYVRCPSQKGVGLAVYNRLLRAAAFEEITV